MDQHFDTESVGGEGVTEQMTTRGVLAGGDTLDYALGLDVGVIQFRSEEDTVTGFAVST